MTSARRAVGALLAVVALPTLLPVAPVEAASNDYRTTLGGAFFSLGVGPEGDCGVFPTSSPSGTVLTFPQDGQVHRNHVSQNATATSWNDATDTTAASASLTTRSSSTVTDTDARYRFSSHGVVQAIAADPATTKCAESAQGIVTLIADFDLRSPGWLRTSVVTKSDGLLLLAGTISPVYGDYFTPPPDYARTTTSYVDPGPQRTVYYLDAIASAVSDYKDAPTQPSVTYALHAATSYFRLGQASGAASGSAQESVRIRSQVSCGQHTLAVHFRKAERSVHFTADGKALRTVHDIAKGETLTLSGIEPTGPSTVVRARAFDGVRRTTVHRAYYGCSALDDRTATAGPHPGRPSGIGQAVHPVAVAQRSAASITRSHTGEAAPLASRR